MVILGGGFAGLRIAYLLSRLGFEISIVEKSNTLGGMVQTFSREYCGERFSFDFGPHLFFDDFLDEYRDLLSTEMLPLSGRFSMIMEQMTLHYPLEIVEMLTRANPLVLLRYVMDFLIQKYRSRQSNGADDNLESIMVKRFGRKLFDDFYLPYIEKCCGMASDKISVLWAKERENVSGKSLTDNILNKAKMMLSSRAKEESGEYSNTPAARSIKAWYPHFGAGQLCDAMASAIRQQDIHLNSSIRAISIEDHFVKGVHILSEGRDAILTGDYYISTIPLPELFNYFRPERPDMVAVGRKLRFRGLRLVNLIVDKAMVTDTLESFSMQRGCMFKRLYEPKIMSPAMAPESASSLCLEVCCTDGDDISAMPENTLIDRCIKNLIRLQLLTDTAEVKDAFIKEMPHAYPIYERGFEAHREVLLGEIAGIDNLITTGRQGLFLYHAMTNEIMSMARSVVDFLAGGTDKRSFVCTQTQWGRHFY